MNRMHRANATEAARRSATHWQGWASVCHHRQAGFTLIELLVTIALIAVLAAIMIPALKSARQKAVRSLALAQLGHPQGEWAHSPGWFAPDLKLESVYQRMRGTIVDAGFESFGLYLSSTDPDGFILVTAPERINPDGTPHAERFNLARKLLSKGPLRRLFENFFSSSPEGEYRIFAFAVTSDLPVDGDTLPEWGNLAKLADEAGDYAHLPEGLQETPVRDARLHAYVYLFVRAQSERYPHPVPGPGISVQEHLRKAGFTNLVETIHL